MRSLVPACALLVCVTNHYPQSAISNRPADAVRLGVLGIGGRYEIASMPLETYVARVLAGEAARDSPPAALEALAIAIRTYALANRNRHRAEGFNLCDQTHCQVPRASTAATERAAAVTASQVLLDRGVPASVFYSASCGGRTEKPSAVWPGAVDPPFLPAKKDNACDGEPAWQADLTDGDLLRSLQAAGFRGHRLKRLRIRSRTESRRVAKLEIEGLTPDVISAQDLRAAVGRALGWQYIRSTAFDLKRDGGIYRFSGRGSGHGVGMCVIGSVRLAEHGGTAKAILSRYYPGLRIGLVQSPVFSSPSPPASYQQMPR